MQWIQIIIFLLTINGLFTLFSVRFNDFLHVLARTQKSTLQDDVDVLLGKPAKGFFNRETLEVEQLLAATGREGRFALVKRASILLFAVGAAAALLLNNPFLIPILGAGFAFAPVWYLRSTAAAYKKHLNEELSYSVSLGRTGHHYNKKTTMPYPTPARKKRMSCCGRHYSPRKRLPLPKP